MDDSHACSISIEKNNEDSVISKHEPRAASVLPPRRCQLNKKSFKSLTLLGEDSLDNRQKSRRRNNNNRHILFGRTLNNGDKRSRKKYYRKKFDKSNVSEVNIRKVTDENEKLVNIIGPWKLVNKSGKVAQSADESRIEDGESADLDLNDNVSTVKRQGTGEAKDEESAGKILDYFEKLRLVENSSVVNSMTKDQCAQNPTDAKSAIDYGSGDVQQDFALNLNLDLPDENFAGMACAQIFDSKRRSVQWKREVDVIYYAGDSNGGKVVRRENEPLREETDQQARRNKFIQLALTKKLLSNASACQLRDPWLVVLPK